MALDGLGPDGIEVDGVISQPSGPIPCKRTCSWVFAPIAFSTRKTFWKKFLGNGVTSVWSVTSIDFIDVFSKHFQALQPLLYEQIRSRDPLLCKKQKPTEKPIGGLPL